jgi:hypothetical protein
LLYPLSYGRTLTNYLRISKLCTGFKPGDVECSCGRRGEGIRLGLRGDEGHALYDVEARTAKELVHIGFAEAGRVVLHAHRVGGFIHYKAADAVDLADLG